VLVALAPEVKQPGHGADHSPPSGAKVMNEWSHTSTSIYHGMHMHGFTSACLQACLHLLMLQC
jgi:hypothetical protein